MTILETLPIGLFICVMIAVATIYRMHNIIKNLNKQIEETRNDRPNSEELTDFLQDVKNHGYGFVRIDPASVFWRSS